MQQKTVQVDISNIKAGKNLAGRRGNSFGKSFGLEKNRLTSWDPSKRKEAFHLILSKLRKVQKRSNNLFSTFEIVGG